MASNFPRQRSWSHQVENSRQFILDSDRLAIVMVGLPARGKSFMAKKIYRYLCHLQLITKIFNFGSYRRIATKNTTVGKASASFFDPDNKEGARIREQCCVDALHDLISWYNTAGGQIGILDATNTTLARRKLIRDFFATKRSELEYNVSLLHVESICNDENKIHSNIICAKLKNPDYCTVDAKKAIHDFKQRIKMYEKAYHAVKKEEGSYIKVIDVGTEVMGHQINDYISCRILYFLMHLHLHSLTKTPRKPLLMQIKNRNAAKADKEQEERLKKISEGIGARFTRKYDRPVLALAPHMRRPSYLMWSEAEDTYTQTPGSPTQEPSKPPRVIAQNINTITEEGSQDNLMSEFQFTPGQYANINPNASPIPLLGSSTTTITPTTHAIVSKVPPVLHPQHSVRRSKYLHRTLSRINLPQNLGHNKSDSDTDSVITSDDNDEDHKDDDEEVSCELCSRTVRKGDTHLVENRRAEGAKVRICEICLYETDSEGDDDVSTVEDQRYIQMHSVPQTPIIPSDAYANVIVDKGNKESKLRVKTEEMTTSITYLLDQLNNTKNINDLNIKEKLIKLKQEMEQLLKD